MQALMALAPVTAQHCARSSSQQLVLDSGIYWLVLLADRTSHRCLTAVRTFCQAAAGGGGAGAAIAAAEHAALQAEVDGGLAACVHLLHGIDLPWRLSTPWGAPVEVKHANFLQRKQCLCG